MKLTILGNNGPFPSAGGACSGYLLEDARTKLLIDCGNGVLGNLQRFIRFEDLDAIILTHLHSDHISDMMVLRYAVQIKRNRGQLDRTLRVYAPPEPAEEYGRLNVRDAFDLQPVGRDTVLYIGDMKIKFEQMKHPVLDYAVSFESGGKRFVFSGDTSLNKNIIEFARNADLLMLDAGLLAKDKTGNAPHLSARECGETAKKAGVKKLLLTHFWPEYDISEVVAEAKTVFKDVEPSVLLETLVI